jgi:hypothetical protein
VWRERTNGYVPPQAERCDEHNSRDSENAIQYVLPDARIFRNVKLSDRNVVLTFDIELTPGLLVKSGVLVGVVAAAAVMVLGAEAMVAVAEGKRVFVVITQTGRTLSQRPCSRKAVRIWTDHSALWRMSTEPYTPN